MISYLNNFDFFLRTPHSQSTIIAVSLEQFAFQMSPLQINISSPFFVSPHLTQSLNVEHIPKNSNNDDTN